MVFRFLNARRLCLFPLPQYIRLVVAVEFNLPSLLFLLKNDLVANLRRLLDFRRISANKYKDCLCNGKYQSYLISRFDSDVKTGNGIQFFMGYDPETNQYESISIVLVETITFTERDRHPSASSGYKLSSLTADNGGKLTRPNQMKC